MNNVTDIAMALVFVAGIFVFVRPGNQGPQFVAAIGNAFSGSIKAATGQ